MIVLKTLTYARIRGRLEFLLLGGTTMKRKMMIGILMALALLFIAACGGGQTEAPPAAEEIPPAVAETPPEEETAAPDTALGYDRAGNPIVIPETIETILSIGPGNTEILVALGFGDKIVGTDEFSTDIPGLGSDLELFNMMAPDGERMIALAPDVIITTGMIQVDGLDPLTIVREAGISVIAIRDPITSIAEIMDDIRFIAAVMDFPEAGEALVAEMEQEIERVRAIGETITERRTVYFEIASPPFMFSFGHGVFLNEILEIIGAENIFADQDQWFSVADEAVLERNPDVILTNVFYLDDAVEDVLNRSGWESISAVAEERVFFIDSNASSRPSHNVILALNEMARAVYPEYFG